jgi:GT2 family glycosyltransferase
MTGTPAIPPHATTHGPRVSILVPSYNGARYLREALDSILAQTYENLEVILLDDASSDETPQIAAEYGDRIIYVQQPTNLYIYENVNVGIGLATGDLIATYHADDIYLPTIVAAQVAYFARHPEVGAVFASDIFVDADGKEYGRLRLPPEVAGERLLDFPTVLSALLTYKNRFFVCPTAMVRASVHRDVGVYRQDPYGIAADLDMWLRIAKKYPMAVLESHLMRYRHFHGNATQLYNHLRTAPDNYFRIVDGYLESGDRAQATPQALGVYEGHRSEDRVMASVTHYIKGEMREGRMALRGARLWRIARSRGLQRTRLLAIATGMWLLLRLPRQERLARRMFERWHVKRAPR